MAMGFGAMELLLVLLSGGNLGNDLLDYLPTSAYWKAKAVTVSAERMAAELTVAEPAELPQLIRDLGAAKFEVREAATAKLRALGPVALPALKKAAVADDPEVRTRARELLSAVSGGAQAMAVRHLMAIRTLGELKKPETLPALRALLESKEPFVADYARQAIAAVQDKPCERLGPSKEQLWSDVCLLPANCGIVAQMRVSGGKPVAFDTALQTVAPMLPAGRDASQLLDELAQGICMVAERVGNLRIDAVTLGVADNVGDRTGFAVIVARGLYDAQAAREALKQMNVATTDMDGVEAFRPDNDVRLVLCSNERLVFTGGPSPDQLPLKELAAALKTNPDKPALAPRMLELVRSVDPAAPAWAAVVLTDAYRLVPVFAPFDTAVLTSKRADETTSLTLVAAGKDAEAVKPAVAEVEKGLKEAREELLQHAGQMPFLKPIQEFLASVTIRSEGAKVTATATLKGQGAAFMMPMMFLMVGRSAAARPMPEPPAPMEKAPAPAPQ